MAESEERKRGRIDLSNFSPDELREMQEGADDTGYYKGIPLGLITRELEKKMGMVVQPEEPTLSTKPPRGSSKKKGIWDPIDGASHMAEINRIGTQRARSKR